ncbi:MAG: hypothetical protein CMK07_15185 [Ponticaulis sp.]|nr:hypothetical protein [Ponticaulis sp.]
MSEVIVHVAVGDAQIEDRFIATMDEFTRTQAPGDRDAFHENELPLIIVKTLYGGQRIRKAITFQDKKTATEFLSLWRQRQMPGN